VAQGQQWNESAKEGTGAIGTGPAAMSGTAVDWPAQSRNGSKGMQRIAFACSAMADGQSIGWRRYATTSTGSTATYRTAKHCIARYSNGRRG